MPKKRSEYSMNIVPITNSLTESFQAIESSDHLYNLIPEKTVAKHLSNRIKSIATPKSLSTQDNKLLLPEVIQDKSEQTVSPRLVKQISRGLSFAEDVVIERSPHLISYNKNPLDKIYSEIGIKKQAKKPFCRRKQNHSICKKKIEKEGSTGSGPNSEFVLGITNSIDQFQNLEPKTSALHLPCSRTKTTIPYNDSKEKIKAHTWEEHVLAKLNKSTSDMIIKKLMPSQRHEKLKLFLHDMEVNKNAKTAITESVEQNCSDSTDNDVDHLHQEYFLNIKHGGEQGKVRNVLQNTYPCSPLEWSNEKDMKNKSANTKTHKLIKGMKKWKTFPVPIDTNEVNMKVTHLEIEVSKAEETCINLKESIEEKNNRPLLKIVDEWRSKWLLEKKSYTIEELLKAMSDINDHVRLAAVSTAGTLLRNQEESQQEMLASESKASILNEVKNKLSDPCQYVSVAAAATLYSVDRGNQQASEILMKTVKHGAPTERWLAVQCLAEYEHVDDCVIRQLLTHINGSDVVKSKKASELIKNLSCFTESIQYMLAEQLNSTSWKDRVTACKVFPILNGTLRKDIANKLSFLMWNDWNTDVRVEAANALGRTSNGKLVHDTLCKYLTSDHQIKQIEALKKISHFGIITPHLFPPILSSLQSKHDAVCLECIKAVNVMRLNDEEVIQSLIKLVSSDRNWKIKAFAINALGSIGKKSSSVRDCLLWALHYGKKTAVRVEACATIGRLAFKDTEVVNVLRDMIVVEKNERIKRQVERVLSSMGLEPSDDVGMMDAIRDNVKHLCRKDIVIASILLKSVDFQTYLDEFGEGTKQFAENTTGGEPSSVSDKNFPPSLEAYRIRKNTNHETEIPRINPSYIPYWSESSESFFDPR